MAAAPASEDRQETEWQFDAVDLRPVERWLRQNAAIASARGAVVLTDTYLDTEDWRLHRAGYTLRIRVMGDAAEATMKSMAAAVGGVRSRREITEQLPFPDVEALRRSSGPVGTRVRLLCGPRPLMPLFEAHTLRRSYDLEIGGASAEVGLDETTIPMNGAGDPARLTRVEVEFEADRQAELDGLVRELQHACGLVAAGTSKFAAGLLVRGLAPPTAPERDGAPIDASVSVGQAAFAVMRRQFAAMLSHEPGARLGEDLEEVHDMRVAIRRLRAAMGLFGESLPFRATRLRRELGWVAAVLGQVRDLDVQIEELRGWVDLVGHDERRALTDLVALLERRRSGARRRLVRSLDSRRYERLCKGFAAFLDRGPSPRQAASAAPLLEVAADLVERRYRKVRKVGDAIGPGSAAGDYHELRIRCKRLRYALEFLSPVAPRAIGPVVRDLVRLQDVLGAHQDADVAVAHLGELATADGAELSPATVFTMGRLAARYDRRAEELRGRFPKAYRRLRGKAWSALRAELEVRRPPPA